jgi:hypothetical protein
LSPLPGKVPAFRATHLPKTLRSPTQAPSGLTRTTFPQTLGHAVRVETDPELSHDVVDVGGRDEQPDGEVVTV